MSNRWKSHPHDTVPMNLLDNMSTQAHSRAKNKIRRSHNRIQRNSKTDSRSCSPNRTGSRRHPRSAAHKNSNPRFVSVRQHEASKPLDDHLDHHKDDYDINLFTKSSDSSSDRPHLPLMAPRASGHKHVFQGANVVRSEILKANSYDSKDGRNSYASISSKDVLDDLGLTLREQMILATQLETEILDPGVLGKTKNTLTHSPKSVNQFKSSNFTKSLSLEKSSSRAELSDHSSNKSIFKGMVGSSSPRSTVDPGNAQAHLSPMRKNTMKTTSFRNKLNGHLFAPDRQRSVNPRSFGRTKSLAKLNPQSVELVSPVSSLTTLTASSSHISSSTKDHHPTQSLHELGAALNHPIRLSKRPALPKVTASFNTTTTECAILPPREVRNSTPFKHAQKAGKVWQTIVGEFVRFPTIWFNGSHTPSLGVPSNRNNEIMTKWSYVCLMRHQNVHLSSYVKDKRSCGRILLHIKFIDAYGSENVNCVQDLAIGCFHPNSKRIYRKNPYLDAQNTDLEDTEDSSRDVWMALRRGNVRSRAKVSSLESWLTLGHSIEAIGRSSPISSNKRSVSNDNVRYVFGDEPPLQTVMIRANDLDDLLLKSNKTSRGASSSPVNLLLRKYVYGK